MKKATVDGAGSRVTSYLSVYHRLVSSYGVTNLRVLLCSNKLSKLEVQCIVIISWVILNLLFFTWH